MEDTSITFPIKMHKHANEEPRLKGDVHKMILSPLLIGSHVT